MGYVYTKIYLKFKCSQLCCTLFGKPVYNYSFNDCDQLIWPGTPVAPRRAGTHQHWFLVSSVQQGLTKEGALVG